MKSSMPIDDFAFLEMEGKLFRVLSPPPSSSSSSSSDSPHHLLGFIVNEESSNALVFVGGLGDGFLSLQWMRILSHFLHSILGFALVQINLGSSFNQFGISTLDTDAEEVRQVVLHLRNRWNFKNIVLMGHSTGAQICLRYLQKWRQSVVQIEKQMKEEKREKWASSEFHNNNNNNDYGVDVIYENVEGIILLSGVSDREAMNFSRGWAVDRRRGLFGLLDDEAAEMEDESEKKEEWRNRILSVPFMGAALTVRRWKSLSERLGDDDVFSTDMSEEEVESQIWGGGGGGGGKGKGGFMGEDNEFGCPLCMIYGVDDEYVPDMLALKIFIENTFVKVVERYLPHVEFVFMKGSHSFELKEDAVKMIQRILDFISERIITKERYKTEEEEEEEEK